MTFETIQFNEEDHYGLITMNRPQAMNALNETVLNELNQCVEDFNSRNPWKTLVLTGQGQKAFVAGADIKQIHDLDHQAALEFSKKGQKIFWNIETLSNPVIAAVNGFALGGGLELALACDFIFCSETAKLGLPECTLGLLPGFGGTVRLARRVGPSLGKQWTMSGEMISSDQALRSGLVNRVCSPDDLLSECFAMAKVFSKRAPLAIAGIKKCIHETYGLSMGEALAKEAQEFSELFKTQDCREGTLAFIEKRKPKFVGQ